VLYLTPCPGDNLSGGVTEVWDWVTIRFCINVGSDISGSESETMHLEVRPVPPQSPYQCIHQVWPKLDSTSNNSSFLELVSWLNPDNCIFIVFFYFSLKPLSFWRKSSS